MHLKVIIPEQRIYSIHHFILATFGFQYESCGVYGHSEVKKCSVHVGNMQTSVNLSANKLVNRDGIWQHTALASETKTLLCSAH